MNYRHAYHAGSFADVVKHAVMARILVHLAAKPQAFRVIDTHAGLGRYDLTGREASRTGEWRAGIARLLVATLPAAAAALAEPYLATVRALNERGALRVYPGSPLVARALMRPQDRLTACELEPQAAKALAHALKGDLRLKAVAIDGWTALNAYVPPKERRGLVVVDPPFEAADDFTRLAEGLSQAHRKWPTGIYLLWYPIKDRGGPDVLARKLRRSGIAKIMRTELLVAPGNDPDRLNGAGLIIVNPPWTLENELAVLLPALAGLLATDGPGRADLGWLAAES
jgi:23S rRNA (adenine2030-N6)-methyltransferase